MSITVAPSVQADPVTLTLKIDHSRPVELGELVSSLEGFRDTYLRFVDAEGTAINGEEIKLYIREIKAGSIVVDLLAIASFVPTIIEHATSVATSVTRFAQAVKAAVDFFRGKADKPPPELTARDAQDLGRIVGPAINDPGGGISIIATEGSKVMVNIALNSDQAAGVKHRAASWASLRELPSNTTMKDALFYWFQARGDSQAKTGDRGIIEAISKRPIKVTFASDEIKRDMLDEALFRKAYIVDVSVQTVSGRPQLYNITRVSESFEKEE